MRIRELPGHEFWSDVSPADSDARAFEHRVGHRQVSDAHLLTLALRRGGTLATLDRGLLELASESPSSVELVP